MKPFNTLIKDLKLLENTIKTKSVDKDTARRMLSHNLDTVLMSEPYLTFAQADKAFRLMDSIQVMATQNYGLFTESDEVVAPKSKPTKVVDLNSFFGGIN